MARGGKRTGSGRKVGSATKRTREIADAAIADGLTPLEYMLGILRNDKAASEMRFEAAKAAAPYVHPRLQAIEHGGPGGGNIMFEVMTGVGRTPTD